MAGRPNRGSRHGQKPTGENTVDPNWKPRPAKAFSPVPGEVNAAVVKHGARSPLIVNPEAEAEIERLREEHGAIWLERFDANVLYLLARAMVRYRRLDEYIESHEIDEIADKVWQQVSRESRDIRDSARVLGFTAVDRAALAKDGAWARALNGRSGPQLGERGRAMRQQQGRLPAGSESDDAGGDGA